MEFPFSGFQIVPYIFQPVWRNGRMFNTGPKDPGFESRARQLVFLFQAGELIATVRWPSSPVVIIGPGSHKFLPSVSAGGRVLVHSTVKIST